MLDACDIQHVHIESLHCTCSDLVPFGSSGDFGSEHSSLRTLVYVPRGRQCPRRAGHSRCDSTPAVVAHARHICDGPRAWEKPREHSVGYPTWSSSLVRFMPEQFSSAWERWHCSCEPGLVGAIRTRVRAICITSSPVRHCF